MGIIARRTLRNFVESRAGHEDQPVLKAALDAWFSEVKNARWANTADINRSRATAGIATAERVVFNIKGNAYGLVAAVDLEKGIVWIKWIGTHEDYDRIDATEVEYVGRTETDSQRVRPRPSSGGSRAPLGCQERHGRGRSPGRLGHADRRL